MKKQEILKRDPSLLVPAKLINEWDQHFHQAFCYWQGKRIERLALEKKFKKYTGHIDIMELHVPYTKYGYAFDRMDRTQSDYKRTDKMLFLNGDNINLDLFSPFYPRSTDNELPMLELETFIKFLKVAHKVYDHILVLLTNHDKRVYKLIQRNIMGKDRVNELLKWVKSYEELLSEIENLQVIDNPVNVFQVGDVIMAHKENNSKIPGTVLRKTITDFVGCIEKPFSVVMQSHTHYQTRLSWLRKIGIETGCLARVQDYWRGAKIQYEGKTSTLGYAICDMDNGVADLNKTNFVICEFEDFI